MSQFKRLFMTRNVGALDRALRTLPAIIAVWAWTQGFMAGTTATAIGIGSVMLLITAVTGTCSIYGLFGVSTRRRSSVSR